MSQNLFVQQLPPGEMQALACQDCGGQAFHLHQEVRDGSVEAFHTRCAQCGKRGALDVRVETRVRREFIQFADPAPIPETGYTVVVGTLPDGAGVVTTTSWGSSEGPPKE